MKKLIDFKGLEVEIQEYANEFYEGNFNMAVRALIKAKLNKRL